MLQLGGKAREEKWRI